MKNKLLTGLVFALFFVILSVKSAFAFTFTVAGDYAGDIDADNVLNGIKNAGGEFNLAVGDLSYGEKVPESAWCDYVKSFVGSTYPFELLAGNHEDDFGRDGFIDNFAACLPDRFGNIQGTYAKEYYFDYQGLARFILISPNLTMNGQYYDYSVGTSRYLWVSNAIDSARQAGIKWIIVGAHQYCLNVEDADCPIGDDIINLLVSKKVDLVLHGHAHQYSRSKQLSLGANCPAINNGVYNSNCVASGANTGAYTKDSGTVFMIVGTGGSNLSYIDTSDAELPYFVSWSGGNINPTFGFAKISVTNDALTSQFIATGPTTSFSDSYSIVSSSNSNQSLISAGSTWKYLDNGTNQGSLWRDVNFDDTSWKNGAAPLGYGDGDETTATTGNIITTYFRKNFNVDDPTKISWLGLDLVRDDGAIVYINGQEVVRTNMPSGSVSYNTLSSAFASPPEENFFNSFVIPTSVLVQGNNVIAVEMHQASVDSVDMSFDVKLNASISDSGLTPTETLAPSPTGIVTPTTTPTLTLTPTPVSVTGTELLKKPWHLTAKNGASEAYQSIAKTALQGMDTIRITYDLHGLRALGGDASALIFDQNGWKFISLSNFGQNGLNGVQTVDIPLSAFPGLDLTKPVGTMHVRFWYGSLFTVDITSIFVYNSQSVPVTPTPVTSLTITPTVTPIPFLTVTPTPTSGLSLTPTPTAGLTLTPTPTPVPTSTATPTPTPATGSVELLPRAWHLTGNNGAAEAYQSIPSNVLAGKSALRITYDLHGLNALGGDASALIFDQNGWQFISLSNFGRNGLNGVQTVDIPLSAFSGLNVSQPVGTLHTRFWFGGSFTVDITSVQAI